MNRASRPILTLLIILPYVAWSPATGETAMLAYKGKWEKREVRTIAGAADIPRADPGELSAYGGYTGAWRSEATGHFRTELRDKRWWFIDPLGYPFISMGVNSVALGSFSDEEVSRKFANRNKWAESATALLRKNSFNSLGRWCDMEDLNRVEHRMPYAVTMTFLKYSNLRPAEFGLPDKTRSTIPVFDEGFAKWVDGYAEEIAAPLKDDPFVLGYYTDNELPFRPNSLELFLALPESDRGHKEAVQWLTARKRTPGNFAEADSEAFMEHMAFTYYSVVTAALRKHDPNHLVIGSRQHGRTITPALMRGSRPLDVISLNYYHAWNPDKEQMDMWLRESRRPFIQSEWYAMRVSDPKARITGAGYRVATHRDRGLFYQNHVLGLLDHPGMIGWHWFKYGHDKVDFTVGMVDSDFKPFGDMLQLMGQLNERVYPMLLK